MPAPSPESFLDLINRSRRGRLKVYLGYGPGVGKTYQMLLEGQRLKSRGVDVVVGFVETHDRVDTASLCLGLTVLPRRRVVYRGVQLDELDLAAILARRPEVVLIDELAHTNVPGSPNAKRYQDVLEVLAAGIHVITTLNVQHLESLYDTVERLIGVKVKERLPDWVIADADEIVNVDLATEDLRRRLAEGRIYEPGRAAAALDNFFRKSNLEQLRELAFREVASMIERKGRMATGADRVQAPDQIVVCISSRSPDAAALLRYGSRLAGRLNRNWYALYVQTSSEEPARLDRETGARLSEALALAGQLGAMVFTFKGEDIADTILRFAREYRVGHVVVGRPGRLSLVQRLFGRRTPVERLIESADGLSVVVVDELGVRGEEEGAPAHHRAAGPSASPTAAAPAEGAQRARPAAGAPNLSDLLTAESIALFAAPVERDELLRALVDRVASLGAPALDAEDLLRRVLRREREGSTFLAGGLALPHVRLPELAVPRVALGLLAAPQVPEPGSGAIDVVVLFLFPDRSPEIALHLLAATARMFRDPSLRAELRRAASGAQALAAIREFEAERADRSAPGSESAP